MAERQWHDLEEIDAEEATFPLACTVDGADMVVFQNGDSYCGVQRLCPHQDADFVRCGMVMGNGTMLRCRLHGWVFKLDTGKGVNAGQKDGIEVYEVERDGSRLKARKK
jgi:nitrite reductase/ring-hydroxylating ferredoxin subunit